MGSGLIEGEGFSGISTRSSPGRKRAQEALGVLGASGFGQCHRFSLAFGAFTSAKKISLSQPGRGGKAVFG
jgi:hypothetical protein